MDEHENLQFKDPSIMPTNELLGQVLASSFNAYEEFIEHLPRLEIEQEWQWYKPYKAWFAKGQYFWTTSRGTRKEKNLYWLYVYKDYFSIAVWFKEKNRPELLSARVNDDTIKLIISAQTMGKLPTFPVVFEVISENQLADIYALISLKKQLES